MAESYSVEAILSAKDQMSGVLGKVAGETQSLGSRIKSTIGLGAAMGVGMKAVGAVMNTVKNSIGGAVQRFDTLNNFPKVMENMKIPAKDASEQLDRAAKAMEKLPTSLDTAASGIQRFTSANGDIKKSTDYFLALNDAVIAGGQSSEVQASAMEQLSQAYSKGKMDMMEWRSLQQAMPAQLNQVAKAMGMSADALGEGLRNGSVSMDDFMGKIVELDQEGQNGFKSFKEQAEASCDGIQTAIANVKTAITRGIAGTFTKVDEVLKNNGLKTIGQTINSIIPAIDSFSGKVSGLVDIFAKVATGAMSGANLGSLIAGKLMTAFDGLDSLIPKITSFLSNAFTTAVQAVTTLLPTLISRLGTTLINLNLNFWQNLMPTLLTGASNLLTGLIGSLSGLLSTKSEMLVSAIPNIINKLLGAVSTILSTDLPKIINILVNTMGNLLSKTIPSFVGTIKTSMLSVLDTLPNIIGNLANSIGPAIERLFGVIGDFASKLPDLILDFVKEIPSKVLEVAPKLATAAGKLIGHILKGFIKNFPKVISGLFSLLLRLPGTILKLIPKVLKAGVQIIGGLLKGLISSFPNVLSSIWEFAKSIPSKIWDGCKNIVNIGKNIVEGLWNGIGNMVGWIADKIKGFCSNALGAIKKFFGIKSPSRVMRDEVGKNTALGMAEGVEKSSSAVDKSIQTVNTSVSVGGNAKQGYSNSYNFGNITIDVKDLEDIPTVQDFVNMMSRAKAFA